MSCQVIRPVIPYRGAIPGGLHEGKLIEIKGSVPYGADMFAVNLMTGMDNQCDRPLHLSVRFSGRTVVRNSLERSMWGTEERHGSFPFHSGKDFLLMILVDVGSYRIAVNNQHCWEFHHRLPVSRVTAILIEGSVHVEKIQFMDQRSPYQQGACYPTVMPVGPGVQCIPSFPTSFPTVTTVCPPPTDRISSRYPTVPSMPTVCPTVPSMPTVCPTLGGRISPGYSFQPAVCPPGPNPSAQICPQPGYIPTGGGSNLAPVYNPSIPYAYPVYGGLKPGMMAYISGRPSGSPYRFTLNFQAGTSPYPPPDIAFHVDVRFHSHSVVRNSRSNNVWGGEETALSHFPFQPGVHFDMIIRVEADRFMVALNGQHLFEFRHRLHPASRFDTLYIENDIVVSSIRFA